MCDENTGARLWVLGGCKASGDVTRNKLSFNHIQWCFHVEMVLSQKCHMKSFPQGTLELGELLTTSFSPRRWVMLSPCSHAVSPGNKIRFFFASNLEIRVQT